VTLKVLACGVHGQCTPTKKVDEIACCDGCPDRQPAPAGPVGIAPLVGGFVGALARKPHQYRVTVVLPHLDTVPQLTLALALWRCQSVRPYFLVIDTGSPWPVVEQLEREVRAPDCEVHYVRAHGYQHSSAPVTTALDLAHTLCRTPHLFHTHADVFPHRRDFLEWLLAQATPTTPVVGWQMSPRTDPRGSETRHEWDQCVSHTATMLHMPTCHRARLTWAMEAYYASRPHERGPTLGWPDTESPFLLGMRAAGIAPTLLGTEPNYRRHDIAAGGVVWAEHARSYTGLKAAGGGPKWVAAQRYMQDAMRAARDRLAGWRAAFLPARGTPA